MLRERTYNDGQVIELRRSGNGNPPDSDPSLQHTNCPTNWFRVNGGPWVHIHSRSLASASVYLEASETAEEFLATLQPSGISSWWA